jgi:homoserine O-acetyltransferase
MTMDLFELGEFRLSTGLTIPAAKLRYKTRGTLNAKKDNAILFPHFLGGSPEALEGWIGDGRTLDPRKYFIVLPGQFADGASSSPNNTSAPFERGAFPAINIADDVVAQRRLVESLGIQELQLVCGWSTGALQTYEWAVRFPGMVKRVASIAGAPKPSPWTKLWLRTIIEESITSDPAWKMGFYRDATEVQAGLRHQARRTALTLPPLGFYREGKEMWRSLGFASMEDFVSRFWEAFWLSQDPNCLVWQARKAQRADPSGGGDIAKVLGQITARTTVVAFTGDPMFPAAECKGDADRIPRAQFREITSQFGHLATFGLCDEDRGNVDNVLREVLSS